MIYRNEEQAKLELEMNERLLPQFRWKIAEYDGTDGKRRYKPIKVCRQCGEMLTENHRC